MIPMIPRRVSAMHRLILITVLITGIIVLSITTLTHLAVQSTIRDIEQGAALDSADRTLLLLAGETATLNRTAYEWGSWTEAWEYLNGTNPGFINTNLNEKTFQVTRLSRLLFYDQAGRFIGGSGLNPDNSVIQINEDVLSQVLVSDGLIGSTALENPRGGLLVSGEQIYLVATCPVKRSDESGSPIGTVVAVQEMDEAAVDRMAIYMPGPISLSAIPSGQSVPGSLTTHNVISLAKLDLDQRHIITETVVPDILGRPIIQVRTKIPSQGPYGSGTIIALLLILLGGLALLITGLYYGFTRFFLIYIKEIGEGLERAAETGRQEEVLPGDIPPELNPLAGSATRIMNTLEEKHSHLIRSEQERKAVGIRWETLFNAASELILIGDNEGILTANPRFLELTGLTHDALIGSPVSDLPFRILDREYPSLEYLWNRDDSQGQRFIWQLHPDENNMSADLVTLDADLRFVIIDGRQLRFLIARDITEEMRLREEQEQAIIQIDRNIAQLAALNDEIRNPLMQIMGWTELDGPSHQKEILEGVSRIDAIVHRIDIGFVESDKVRAFLHRSIEGFTLRGGKKDTAPDENQRTD